MMAEETKGLRVEPDRRDVLAFIFAFWQLFLPMIFVFLLLFLVAVLILYLM